MESDFEDDFDDDGGDDGFFAASDGDDFGGGEDYASDDFDEFGYEDGEDGLWGSDDFGEDDGMFGGGEDDGGSLSRAQSFECVSEGEILNESAKLIGEVMEFLGIENRAIAAVLMRGFGWNKERLINAYLGDPSGTLGKAGLKTLQLEAPVERPDEVLECPVCMDDFRAADSFALPCGHRFCSECWKGHLAVKVDEGPGCIFTTCMAPKCSSVVHEDAFKRMLSAERFAKFSKYVLRSFVDDNKTVKWCPSPDCTHCIRCERIGRSEAVVCACGFRFCFSCADYDVGDHMPASCDQVEEWRQKASDESENVNWMIANTKKCPKCRSPIEKNGGCMHMTCRKNAGGCGHDFCWLCRGPWSEHGSHTGGYYNCNKYDASTAKEDDMKAADAKTELEHYMFYYHRYESHREALKIADEQRRKAHQRRHGLMEKFDVRNADTKFLAEATEQLMVNRRVLQWSYVYGYYISLESKSKRAAKEVEAEKNLYEYLQEDVEKHTNYLSELYERPIARVDTYHAFIAWKEEVANYTRVCNKFVDKFVQGVSDGLTTGGA